MVINLRLYLECSMGASGDMLMAALYELLPDKDMFRHKMDRLGLPGVSLEYSTTIKCGIRGTHISVLVGGEEEISDDVGSDRHVKKISNTGNMDSRKGKSKNSRNHHDHHHHHEADGPGGRRYGYQEILDLIRGLDLPDNVSCDALSVYEILGKAEAAVHGVPLGEIHLHEVGSLDAIADIVGCCLLMNMLGVTDIMASPVHVGSGSIRCEHGILPVPAPATAEILKGIPIYGGEINGELCTPTGAALLRRFAGSFGQMPLMTVLRTGYGMGTKDFEAANCLRAFLCEDEVPGRGNSEEIFELSCNLDDMTPEAVGAVFGVLFENGALDVYSTPIIMKKNRLAVMLSCLCADGERDELIRLMLVHTSTLGVRISVCRREVMTRAIEEIPTEYGNIRVKRAYGYGTSKLKPEYDDVLAAASKNDVPFLKVFNAALRAAEERMGG